MNIRPYRQSDIPALEKLMTQLQGYFSEIDASKEIQAFRSPTDAHAYMERIINDVANMEGALYIAEEDGSIVGFVQGIINRHTDQNILYDTTHNPSVDGWIGLLFVEPSIRGKGAGSALFETIKQYFQTHGCTTLRLLVMQDNVHSVDFYKRKGMRVHDIEMAMAISN